MDDEAHDRRSARLRRWSIGPIVVGQASPTGITESVTIASPPTALPQESNRIIEGLPRWAIVRDVLQAEHGAMHARAGHDEALILIRTAADRIRRAYLDGTLEPATAELVERALVDLDQLGPAAAGFVDDIVRSCGWGARSP